MSVFGDVLTSLQAMNQLQLLLAFLACTGYAVAQGSLVGRSGRRVAWPVTLLSAVGFAFESTEWMYAAMLCAFAVAGLGLFVASAWLLSRALGFSQPRAVAEAAEFAKSVDAAESEFASAHLQPALSQRAIQPHSEPAHSL